MFQRGIIIHVHTHCQEKIFTPQHLHIGKQTCLDLQ